MAKIKLDDKLVESALNNISNAKSQISGVEGEMTSALGLITGARGSEYIDASVLNTGLVAQSDSDEKIDDAVETINSLASQIKEWNEDVDGMGFLERFFSTGAMVGLKVGEGFLGAGEQLVDGFASLIGWGAGKLGFKDAQDRIGNFIAKDHVGDAFHNFYYNTDVGKRITQGSYISENGRVAGFCKLVGTALGYTAALSVGGLGSSMAASATAAGIGAMGGTMQAGLGAGMSYDEAFKKGLKNAAISAALVVGVSCFVRAAAPHVKNAWNKFTGKGSDLADDAVREAGKMGDEFANSSDDFVENATKGGNGGPKDTGAGFDTGGGPNPKGPNGGPGGSGGSGVGNLADDSFNSLDDVLEAVKRGDITPDQARQFVNNKAASAVSKADKVAWHPDKIEGALRQFENAQSEVASSAASSAGKGANIPGANEVDDGLNALNKAATPNPAQSGVEKVVAENADEAGGLVKNAVAPKQAPTEIPTAGAKGPTVTDTPLDEMTSNITNRTPGVEDFVSQTSDDASGLVKNAVAPKEIPAEIPTARAGAPGANSYDDALDAAFRKSIGQDAESAMINSVQPKQLPATIPQQAGQILSQSSDDVVRAAGMADDVERAITNEAANMTDDLTRVTSHTPTANPVENAIANTSDDLTRAGAAQPQALVDKAAGASDDLTKMTANVSDDAARSTAADPAAYEQYAKQYADKLDDLDKLSQQFDDLHNAGASQGQYNAVKSEMQAVEKDIADLGQKMENAWTGNTGSGAAQPQALVDKAAGVSDDLTKMTANVSDDAARSTAADPAAYEQYAKQYADKLDDLDKLSQQFDDLHNAGASQGQYNAVKSEMQAVEKDIADLGQKMENAWTGNSGSSASSQLPAEVPAKTPVGDTPLDDVIRDTPVDDAVSKARTSRQLDADLQRLESHYDDLLERQKSVIDKFGEGSPEANKVAQDLDDQMAKIIDKGKQKAAAQSAELADDMQNLTPEQLRHKYVGQEARQSGSKLINGDASVNNPSKVRIDGDVTTNQVASGGESRPAWTDASAASEGDIALSRKVSDHPFDSSYRDPALSSGRSTGGRTPSGDTPLDDAVSKARTSRQLDGDLRKLESHYDDLLEKQKGVIDKFGEGSPEANEVAKELDDQMAKIIDKGKQKAAAQSAELADDMQHLTPEQLKYKYVGQEARQTGNKLINGDASINNPSGIDGNVTTSHVSSGGEVRPSWTDASARVEGQIDGSALKTLPKEPTGLVPEGPQLPATIPQGPQLPATVPPVKPAVPEGPQLPATVPQGPALPATVPPVKPAIPEGPQLPATVPQGPTLPATIPPTGPALPATIPPTGPALPATIPPTGPALPATIPPTGPALPVTVPPTGAMPPATVPPTGAMPPATVPPTGAIPPVVPPTPSTFVAKLPPVTNPGTVPLTSPDLLKRDDLPLDQVATPTTSGGTTPSGGTPSGGNPGGGGGSPGGGGGTPTPTPGTTSVPTTAAPTTAGPTTAAPTTAGPTTAAPTTAGPAPTPAPDPGSEYAPIPDTMTGKKSARDYILPAAIGGVVGAAGLAASHVLRDNDKEYLEEDEDEDDDYNDEYFKDMKEEV